MAVDDYYTAHKRLEVNWPGYLSNDYDPDNPNKYALRLDGGNGGRYTTQWGYINLYLGEFVYTPPAGFIGEDSYTYTICDSSGACASATMHFNVVNSPPVATSDTYTVHGHFEILDGRGFLADDSDPDGDTVNLKAGQNGCRPTANGSLCLYNGPLAYTPNNGFTGQDSCTFQVCDDIGACSDETLYFNVVNDPPRPTADLYTARGQIDIPAPGVLGNDGADPDGDPQTFKVYGLPVSGAGTLATTAYGIVTLYADGRLSYTPTSGFSGVDYLQYTLCDSLGACGAATIYFFVPDAPPSSCDCPLDAPSTGATGPSAPDPVDLVHGREVNLPEPDLTVYNPSGRAAVWQREYRGYQASAGYGSPGLSLGWVHTYDWVVKSNASGAWDALKLVYPSGAEETLTPVLDGGTPIGAFMHTPGTPYVVSGVPGANAGEWQSITVTSKDGAKRVFTPFATGTYALDRLDSRTGQGLSFSWGSGRRLQQVAAAGAGTPLLSFAYDGLGRLATVTDDAGRKVVYSFSSPSGTDPGKLQTVSQVADAGTPSPPPRWSYDYSTAPHQQLTTTTVPSPTGSGTSTATISYDADGKVTSLVDANGNRRSYTYNAGATQVAVRDASNNLVSAWTQNFNAGARGTGITDAANASTSVEYADPQNPSRPTRVADADGKATLYTYDQYGNLLTVTTPRGVTTTYTYDYAAFPLGRLTSVREGDRPATSFAYYEPSGLVQSVTTASPAASGTVTIIYTYDSLGNVLTATGPGNNATSQLTTSFNYTTDGAYTQPARTGQPLTITDNLGHTTHLRYDAQGRVISETDALGHETDASYDLAGRLREMTYPATGQTGTGRARAVNSYLHAGGPLTATTLYDESNTQVRQVGYGYGAEGETLSVSGSTEPASYTYDALYRLKTLRDGKGSTTTYNYDGVGNVSSVQMPGGETIQFPLHDPARRVLRRIDGNGVTTDYSYDDPENLLTDIQYPASPALNVHFGYDTFGRRNLMTDGTGSQSYIYGDLDELKSTTTTYTGLPSLTISYAYYRDGSRQSMTTPAGAFTYSYDAAGRMTGLTNPQAEATAWSYDDNGWLHAQSLQNGAVATYSYDAAGQLTRLLNRTDAATLSDFSQFGYDGAGNRTTFVATLPQSPALSGTTSYEYDLKDQLKREQTTRGAGFTFAFDYDSAGNPTTFGGETKTYNENNQQTGAGFSHDANGNPTTYHGASLSYDAENRLTSFGAALSAGYRGDGLRAWKESAQGRTYFLYDAALPIIELDLTGAVSATNTFGAAGLVSRRAGVQSSFYTFDAQGSVSQRLDASGAAASSHLFSAHGGELAAAGADAFGSGAQWGYYTDAETGLQLLTNRYYDPTSSRFITRDPIGYRGGINLYSYANNRPVMMKDPSGLSPWWLNPSQIHRYYVTGDPNAPDDIYEAGLRGGARWMKCNSPLRGMFVFGGGEMGAGGYYAEGLALGGWNIDGDDLYVGGLGGFGIGGDHGAIVGGKEYILPVWGGEGDHVSNIIIGDAHFEGHGAGVFYGGKENTGLYIYRGENVFYGVGADINFSKFKNYFTWWKNQLSGTPNDSCGCEQ